MSLRVENRDRCRITYLLPNIEAGGTERHLLMLLRRLDPAKYRPSLITTAGGGSLYKDFSELVPVTVIGDPAQGRRFRKGFLEQFATLAKLVRTLKADRPDILHAYLPAANVLGPIAARMAGVRSVIVSKRALANYKSGFPVLRMVEPLGNRLADVILVNSDAVRRDVERTESFWEGKFRKIYNGVAPFSPWTEEEVGRFRESHGFPRGAPVVLTVANFYPYKGHDDLVEAAPLVVAERPDVLFVLVGRDSGTLDEIRRKVGRLGLNGRFRFVGGRTDVPDFIRGCDMFVHPSHEEGFSNAILEAMGAGIAVVACDVGGNPEAVRHGETGLLVPLRQPAVLGDAIVELLRDRDRRTAMGAAGRRRAQEHFSLERMVRDMEDLYESLVARGR